MAHELSMMPRRTLPVPSLLLLALSLLGAHLNVHDAYARGLEQSGPFQVRAIKVADRAVSMRDAINLVRQQSGGRVLDAQDRGDHYRVKVLTPEGVVRVFRVDARTGAVR
jgi:uncharacterized membrane protein YkoI